MCPFIEVTGTISCNGGEIFLCGLEEVYGRYVWDGLAVRVEEEVQGYPVGAELGDREEGGDYGAGVCVVD